MSSLDFAAKRVIHQTLSVLEDIVESISGEATKSRQLCYQSLQESVQVSLALFPAFIHQSGITTGQPFQAWVIQELSPVPGKKSHRAAMVVQALPVPH